MSEDPYKVLGVKANTSFSDIKSAYRSLVKKFHPDAGGDQEKIIAINAAWEALKNKEIKNEYQNKANTSKINSTEFEVPTKHGVNQDQAINLWIQSVFLPIDRSMAEILNPFQEQLKDLSADPYDDTLMESFCKYIEKSQKKIKIIQEIYQSIPTPPQAKNLSLRLYQCFSEIQDGINEWERYTAGYVENYLHDGKEMLREAKKQRLILQQEKQNFPSF